MLAIEKEVFDCFVTIAIATLLTALLVFPSKIILSKKKPFCRYQSKILNFSGILSFQINLCQKGKLWLTIFTVAEVPSYFDITVE